MQIVINISEKNYKMVRDGLAYKSGQVLSDAFKKATVLPESHGRLIDADKVLETIDNYNRDGLTGIFCSYQDGERFKQLIKDLPTVLEGSDKGVQ